MKTKLFYLFVAVLCFIAQSKAENETRLLRFPATNGKEIVFAYGGDLFKVSINGGEADRLTSHVGYEMFPHFSPDGKTIAFTAQYDGNTEVYTIPAEGGEPLRLTYTATNSRDDLGDRMGPNNIVMGWTPDGQQIVYRNRISEGFEGKLYTVAKEGGVSTVIPLPEGGFCSFSPDGKSLAYNRVMREFRTWKYYKGGMADDIWIYDQNKKKVDQITTNVSQDIYPMWVGKNIFFLSDRDRTMNLFVYDTVAKATKKVTSFDRYDIKFPTAFQNTIVFENGGYIYKMDTETRQPEKLSIKIESDNVYARKVWKDGSKYIREASLSANGDQVAVTARGEVFLVPTDEGATLNITRTPGGHEREATYSPDGTVIAYISDKSGETELYVYTKEGTTEQLTSNNDTYIRSFIWSPNNEEIFYTDRANRIKQVNLKTKKVSTILTEPTGEFLDLTISPDGRWLAYSRTASNNFRVIYAYDLTTKKEQAITDKWYSSYSPTFSADGKYLIFTSERDFNPVYSSIEWNYAYTKMNGIYLALLSKETPSPFINAANKSKATKDEPKTPKDKTSAEEKETKPVVKIDFDNINNRIVKLPLPAAYYGDFYSIKDKVYYYTYGENAGLHLYDLNEQKDTKISDYRMSVNADNKTVLFAKDSKLVKGVLPQAKVDVSDAIDLSYMKLHIDYTKEWPEVFNEAWRAFRDGFYEANMHGLDWKDIHEKYACMLPYVKTRLDLNYLIGEMIGELGCGHAYVNPGETDRPVRIKMGMLGADITRDKSGFFHIEKILTGNTWNTKLYSPLAQPGIQVKEGDYIVAIDRIAANTVNDLYKLLEGKANVPTEVSINSKPSLDGAHQVTIQPIVDEYNLRHYEWVQNNIKKVTEASNGKIGYIHIRDMGPAGLNDFARLYYPQLDKEGLIIDDRNNGGGNVSPMLIERLSRQVYRMTMSRTSSLINKVPGATQVGPKVCLINKYSASDGDLFPWSFRAMKLGKLIGMRTWGGIIGISGSLPYLDGTQIRVPFFTNFSTEGHWIIENHGVDPDIKIDNDPIKEWKGEDQQLNKGIDEILKELKNRKALPTKAPAPRIWNK